MLATGSVLCCFLYRIKSQLRKGRLLLIARSIDNKVNGVCCFNGSFFLLEFYDLVKQFERIAWRSSHQPVESCDLINLVQVLLCLTSLPLSIRVVVKGVSALAQSMLYLRVFAPQPKLCLITESASDSVFRNMLLSTVSQFASMFDVVFERVQSSAEIVFRSS